MCKICLLRLLVVDGWLKKYWKVFHTLCQSIFICYLHRRDSPSIFLPCCSYVPPMCKPISRDLVLMLTKMYLERPKLLLTALVHPFRQRRWLKHWIAVSQYQVCEIRTRGLVVCSRWKCLLGKSGLPSTDYWGQEYDVTTSALVMGRLRTSQRSSIEWTTNKNGPTWFSVSVLSHSYR